MRGWAAWRVHLPPALAISRTEVLLSVLGAALGLGVAQWFSQRMLAGVNPWFIAPMGASAVLLFATQTSPLAQPWPVIGGNTVSALIGVTCQHFLGDGGAVAAVAGSLAVATMFALRCLHPPGGAVALTAVLGGAAVHHLGFGFVLWPVAINSSLLVLMALLFNNACRRRYPHRATAQPHHTQDPLPSHRGGLEPQDLDAALASFGELLDVSRDDLEDIVVRAHTHALRRQWQGLRCADLMSRDLVVLSPSDTAQTALRLLGRHKVKALPVVNVQRVLLGIVTMHDLLVKATEGHSASRRTQRVADLMTRQVLTARPEQTVADFILTFSDQGVHHLPVVDDTGHLLGMVTQSDLVLALFQAVARAAPRPAP